jgi:membrane protein
MKVLSIKSIWGLLKDSFEGFSDDKVPKLSGSLAYCTIFSLAPMLLVVIFLAGLFLGREAVQGSLQSQIQQFVGEDAAQQLQLIIKNASVGKHGIVPAVIGIVTLLIGATAVFAEIQDSINSIWHLKLKPKQSWLILLKNRLLSFGIIASIGFLLLISLAASALIEGLGERLGKILPNISVVFFYLVSQVITLLIATFLFSLIFKILPAAKINWKYIWPGALVTAILFMAGRFGISFYINKSDFGSTYGAAGSLIVLLVWVYYSSLILYFGAEFTKAYTIKRGAVIQPKEFAISTDRITRSNEEDTDKVDPQKVK